jgi:glycosyltransferase involved in cell wall biosynthesis
MAKIDIAIPCYNYGRFLRTCVTSVLSQSLKDIRILILDNASTDDSLNIARQLAREDSRVEVLAHPINIGPHANYNAGVEWASSKYFFILDADDLLAPGALERAVHIMEQHPNLAFTYGVELRLEFGPDTMPVTGQIEEHDWSFQSGRDFIQTQIDSVVCVVGASTVIRRTSAQKAAGAYRADLRFADDWELWMRLAMVGDVAYTPAIQSIRRLHSNAQSTIYDGNPASDYEEREAVFRSFFDHEGRQLPDAKRLMRAVRRNLAAKTYWSGLSHIVRGFPRQGAGLLKFCFERRPEAIFLPPISHLAQMGDMAERLRDIAAEAFTGRPHGRWLRDREKLSVILKDAAASSMDNAQHGPRQ